MNGYAGKILRIDLSNRKMSVIETKQYEQWIGGHGIGSAIFWDLVKDKNINGFDPRNVITMMTSPLGGTLVPAAAARTEVQGIGVHSYPIGWFTRSNFGGRFGAMLKYAGWDGIVFEGKADNPIWIDIRNNEVKIQDANDLWGLDTWKTQKEIWRKINQGKSYGDWIKLGPDINTSRTTQRPAIVAIGPAGENLTRVGALIHDAGNAGGQGGFGSVFGSKNIKAISVIGTGSIHVADPNALIEARFWSKKYFTPNIDEKEPFHFNLRSPQTFGFPTFPVVGWQRPNQSRPQACTGCHAGCRMRYGTGLGNESSCAESSYYMLYDIDKNSNFLLNGLTSVLQFLGHEGYSVGFRMAFGSQSDDTYKATDLAQKYGINAYELYKGLEYLKDLNKMGILGPGLEIDCDLPFDKLGGYEFIDKLTQMIAYKKGIGANLSEGFYRASKNWGRLEEDSASGLLQFPYWGLPDHDYDPRTEVEWGYGSILGDRDINEHAFNMLFWVPTISIWEGTTPDFTAEEITKIVSEKLKPFNGDPLMLDYSDANIYSERMAKLVSWHRYYSRFWIQSALYCDFRYPDFWNTNTHDRRGLTGKAEPKFLKAVTGKDISLEDGIELGKKIWNIDNAIWTLQKRHRDMVHFADYVYQKPYESGGAFQFYYLPGIKDGKWEYIRISERYLDREKFEEWKTKFYNLQGWDPKTGWPTRTLLQSLGLNKIADELEKNGIIGEEYKGDTMGI